MTLKLRALVVGLAIAATACTSPPGITHRPDAGVGDGQDGQVAGPVDAATIDGATDAAALDDALTAAEGGAVEASAPDASSDSPVSQVDAALEADAPPPVSCSVANGGCDPNATCTRAGPGTSTCTCNTGYFGRGSTCTPTDSCTVNHGGCTAGQICQSTGPGTNTCPCAPGFIGCTTSCPSPGVSCIQPTAVAVGNFHACALLSTGEVECWGDNRSGQLGTTPNHGVAIPTLVPNVSGATAIEAHGNSTCALLGSSWKCWGDSSSGQLGVQGRALPPVTVFDGVTDFSLGDYTACANVGGAVKCLGDATFGEIGTTMGPDSCSGGSSCSLSPLTVSSPLLQGVRSLSAAGAMVCAVASGGSVVCWGADGTGQIGPNGAGSTCSRAPCSAGPVLVPGLSNTLSVSATGSFACALLQGGTVECWGDNTYGQLGHIEKATCGMSTSSCSTSPLAVTGVTTATAVATGDAFACALLQDGTVDCWGYDGYDDFGVATACPGLPSSSAHCVQTAALLKGVANATRIALGGSACALLQSGAVVCWGDGNYGQLGDGKLGGPYTVVNVKW